ncbi:MAG: hypothetical protein HYX38_21525 [Rhodospirillales bacterium]|nr:hypothetical protein [Rhodospirillales bacterium]
MSAEARLPALVPRGQGHQFVVYGDSCSGIAGALHEKTFASVNAVVQRLEPPPEFIAFLGDEVAGYTADRSELEAQWRHWLHHEMAWLDRAAIPLWNTTSNHTTYDEMSESTFSTMLAHLPRNGPPGQEGLSYFVRRGDLLMVFVHTTWTGLGGEGHVETTWLRDVLHRHADARHKLVLGHHPVFPINGFSGAYQREIGPEHAGDFWNVLVEGGVLAYLCSHILAFDVQVHRGVLQVCTAGAGTAHRMPEGVEYLHCVQGALDGEGLRYQVLDAEGRVRERLSWPLRLATEWRAQPTGASEAPLVGGPYDDRILGLRFTGRAAAAGNGSAQTLLSAFRSDLQMPLWIGLRGIDQRLTAIVGFQARRSPHYWYGPAVAAGSSFDLQLVIHTGMGPGGFLHRGAGTESWSSLAGASAWGAERLQWPDRWAVGHAPRGPADQPFRGTDLSASALVQR